MLVSKECHQHNKPFTFINLSEGRTLLCQTCKLNLTETKTILEYHKFKQKLHKLSQPTYEGKKPQSKLQQLINQLFNQAIKRTEEALRREQKKIITLVKNQVLFKHFHKETEVVLQNLLEFSDSEVDDFKMKSIIRDINESQCSESVQQNIHLITAIEQLINVTVQEQLVPKEIKLKLDVQPLKKLQQEEKSRLSLNSKDYANSYKKKADRFYQNKDFDKAIDLYSKAIELDNTLVSAFNRRGNCHHVLQDYVKALNDFQKAIELKPDFAIAYYNKGNSLRKLKKYKQSIQQFQKSIQLNPTHSDSFINMGVSYKNLKQLKEAIECYDKALKISPLDHVGHYNKALCLIKLNSYNEALQSYDKAINQNPKCLKYMEEKGQLLRKMGKEEQAMKLMEQVKDLKKAE